MLKKNQEKLQADAAVADTVVKPTKFTKLQRLIKILTSKAYNKHNVVIVAHAFLSLVRSLSFCHETKERNEQGETTPQ